MVEVETLSVERLCLWNSRVRVGDGAQLNAGGVKAVRSEGALLPSTQEETCPMYRKSVIDRFAPHLLSLLLAVTILAPLVPVPATPPVAVDPSVTPAETSVNLFDFVRLQARPSVSIDG